MKLSISLPDEDVEFLDAHVGDVYESRSAGVHAAIRLLRARSLTHDYDEANRAWAESSDSADWDSVTGDGIR
jgi:Arc/MetJ-type ribon-helix-helix transcriptional regulator